MYDSEADLRMLYQVYSSQIEFSKDQQWRSGYYAIWILAGLVGLSKLFGAGWSGAFIFPTLVIPVFFFSAYNLHKSWHSIRKARIKYRHTTLYLSYRFERIVHFPDNYLSWRYDFPFPCMIGLSLFFASSFVYWGLVYNIPFCFQRIIIWLIIPSAVTSLVCSIVLCVYIRKSRKSLRQEEESYEKDRGFIRRHA